MDKKELAQLLSDDREQLKHLYDTYRLPLMDLGRQYGLGDEILAEVYQEAFITMYKRGIKGKLQKASNSMHDYLLGIGKFMIYDSLKSNLRQAPGQAGVKSTQAKGTTLTMRQEAIRTILQKAHPECEQLLTLFYYRGWNYSEIASSLGYRNAAAARAKKLQYLQMLQPADRFAEHKNGETLLKKHLKKRMTEAEKTAFDALIKDEITFKNEVALVQDLYQVFELNAETELRELLVEFEMAYKPYKKSSRVLWYLAASVIALLGMAYFFTIIQPASAENLYADYFTPYKNVVHPVIEGVQVLDQKTKAFSTYENRDYREATARFEALYNQTGDSYYLFYQANALMADNKVEEAVLVLNRHLETNDVLQKKTFWYLALAYLKLKNMDEATAYLNKVVKVEGYNYKKAQKLLKTLEE